MTDVEKAREELVASRPYISAATVDKLERLFRAVFAEMRAAEVPEPQPVAEPAKRMMQANPRCYDEHAVRHEWRGSCDLEPRCEAEPETPAPPERLPEGVFTDAFCTCFERGKDECRRHSSLQKPPARTKRMRANRAYQGTHGVEHDYTRACDYAVQPVCEPVESPAPDSYAVSFNKGWTYRDKLCKRGDCEGYLRGVEEMTQKHGIIVREDRAKKRTVSAEARRKIVYAIAVGLSVEKSAAEERADRIIAIIDADGEAARD